MNTFTLQRALSLSAAALLFAIASTGIASALSTITSSLDVGASGANVTSLQQFLAADASVYPEGIVSGYYGSLTRAAVQRYQCKQGIVCGGDSASTGYGRVGPRTLAAINASIGGISTGDVSAPIMSGISVATTSSSVTLSWTTSEPARGTAYYGTSALPLLEASVGGSPVVGGQTMSETAFGYNHVLSISGLSANTNYFYAVKSEDASGNVQLTWPAAATTGQ